MASRRWLALFLLLGLLTGATVVGPLFTSIHSERAPATDLTGTKETPSDPDAAALALFHGRVRDEHAWLAGARVRFKGQTQSMLTDADGRFTLGRHSPDWTRLTAWREGYFIGGASVSSKPLLLTLKPLPAEDNAAYSWVEPQPDRAQHQNCGNCHGEIYREWSLSGHARALTDPHFRNLYEGTDRHGRKAGWSLLDEFEDGAAVCVSCHAPTASLGLTFNLKQVSGVARQGVHCDYCHKIAAADLDGLGLTHGRHALKLLRPSEGQLFFGPLDDVDRQEDAYAPLYRESRYCASCHEGTVFGVPVYTTYSEWLTSPAQHEGKQCQDCHMAPTGRMHNIAPGKGGIDRDPATLANHRFFAGSQEEMLARCLKLTAALTEEPAGMRAVLELRAEEVGHRVPTGFVDHHLLLVVEGWDAAGKPLQPLQGPLLPSVAGRGLAGLPGRLHAKLLSDDRGLSPIPFWRAGARVVDTRLQPGRTERTDYLFPPQLDHVRIRLLYRRFWQEVADVKDWQDNEILVLDRTVRAIDRRPRSPSP